MKKEISTLLTIVFVIGMLLSSCSAPAETSVATEEMQLQAKLKRSRNPMFWRHPLSRLRSRKQQPKKFSPQNRGQRK